MHKKVYNEEKHWLQKETRQILLPAFDGSNKRKLCSHFKCMNCPQSDNSISFGSTYGISWKVINLACRTGFTFWGF